LRAIDDLFRRGISKKKLVIPRSSPAWS
jgi:hypothetical protein